ncbi:MAG: hypothetical protein COB92_00070 [Robiginitomaculum sp.]|nr:MAG: hypothetical protein COB92_00070 [Robiginitomaculum sp.]
MIKKLHKYIRSFLSDHAGTAAIEAAIMIPLILAPIFFGTVDLGMAINSGQNLTSTTRAASQYLLNGGRSELDLIGVINDSFEGTLLQSNISIATSCACPNADAISVVEGQTTPLPYDIRTATLETMEQCSVICSDGAKERVLVNLSIDYTTNGLYKDIALNKTISVRIE